MHSHVKGTNRLASDQMDLRSTAFAFPSDPSAFGYITSFSSISLLVSIFLSTPTNIYVYTLGLPGVLICSREQRFRVDFSDLSLLILPCFVKRGSDEIGVSGGSDLDLQS